MLSNDKQSLRCAAMAARSQLDVADAQGWAQAACRNLLVLLAQKPQIIAGYRAIRGELDIAPAMEALPRVGHTLCLPVIVQPGAPLLFRRWQPGQALEKGLHDIEIPPAFEPYVEPDIVIVPLLAFDAQLHRLGYGAGYYDRTIAQLRQSQKSVEIIGIGFSMQETALIPADGHDQRLDKIVTEKGRR